MANPPKQTHSRVPFGLDAEVLVKELMENVAAGTCNNLNEAAALFNRNIESVPLS